MQLFGSNSGAHGPVTFEERQPMPFYVKFFTLAAILAVLFYMLLSEQIGTDLSSLFSITFIITLTIVFLFLSTTITIVDDRGLTLRRRLSFHYTLFYDEIIRAEPKSYKQAASEFGRFALFADLMNYIHDKGVLLYLIDGKYSFASSKRADELAKAINEGREQFEHQKYV